MFRRVFALAVGALVTSSALAYRTASVSLLLQEDLVGASNYVTLDEAFVGLEHMCGIESASAPGISLEGLNHPAVASAFGSLFGRAKSHMTVVVRGLEEESLDSPSPVYTILDNTLSTSVVEEKVAKLTSDFVYTHEGGSGVVVASEDTDVSNIPSNIAALIISKKGVSVKGPTHHKLLPVLRELESTIESRVRKFYEHLEDNRALFDLNEDTDLVFITEMVILRKIFGILEDQVEEFALNSNPDIFTFMLSSLEKMSEKYGSGSPTLLAAHHVLQKCLTKSAKAFSHLYKHHAIEVIGISPALSAAAITHHLERRATSSNRTGAAPSAGSGWGSSGFSTNPVIAGYQNCAPNAQICQTVYSNCSGRGVCVQSKKVVANSTDLDKRSTQNCWVCDCTFNRVLSDDGTVDTRYKNIYHYTGQACQYENFSEHFHLLFWSSIILAFLLIFVVVGTIRSFDDGEGGYAVGSGVKTESL
ncbi:hypothetical protein M427DRAFT_57027 [Gonapodya prolifera JEL478]|uniref:Uncharacterized protein n=1 Tax=Gonapodya prolifera (strain JEL478) TaxID=1344416 RepID=A0A139AFG6_GONPJ|nr:hypothetical protein M427DRAFT_57027 [Gonapodya prolifera JEL478]|eukprot:KXS15153.1 hypothetical protein M427DRAFT_57027 [Gonapodya prolifera JEL478]